MAGYVLHLSTKENIRKIAKTITSSHKQLVIMKPAAAKAE